MPSMRLAKPKSARPEAADYSTQESYQAPADFMHAMGPQKPGALESQLAELTVSSEISKLNRSFSLVPKLSNSDQVEIERLRKIEFQRLPMRAKIATRLREAMELIIAFFSGKKTGKRGLTPTAQKAITQLRQIAALYSAMPQKSLEETIVFDAAFGKAYYEILSSAYQTTRHRRAETESDLSQYQKAIDGFIDTVG